MDDFSPPQQQSTLTQNDFSTKRGAANFNDTIDIENCAIVIMHEHMLKDRAAVTRGSADKQNAKTSKSFVRRVCTRFHVW